MTKDSNVMQEIVVGIVFRVVSVEKKFNSHNFTILLSCGLVNVGVKIYFIVINLIRDSHLKLKGLHVKQVTKCTKYLEFSM